MVINALYNKFGVAVTFGDGSDSNPTKYVDCFQSIKKPLFNFRFSEQLTDDAVHLAYVASEELDSNHNVKILDRSWAAPENALSFVLREETFSSNAFSSYYKQLLVTNKHTEALPSKPLKPLYYKHTLPSIVDVATVIILDENFVPIDTSEYEVEIIYVYNEVTGTPTSTVDEVLLYNDFKNKFNRDTGEVITYYAQYKTTSGGVQTLYTKLLSNKPIYTEASVTDIWSVSGKLKPWVHKYAIQQAGNLYDFFMPSNDLYWVRYEENSKIGVAHPGLNTNIDPWFPRISNGNFIHNYLNTEYLYEIAEFRDQQFNPIAPYKLAISDVATKVAKNILIVNRTPTAMDIYDTDIIIKDIDDTTVLYALTTDASKHGDAHVEFSVASGVNWDSTKILSYDVLSGMVQVDIEIKDYHHIYATYFFEEIYYEYGLINMNPLTNSDVFDSTYLSYLVPKSTALSNTSQAVSLHHIRIGKDGIIEDCSQDGTYGEPDIKDDVIGMRYGKPDAIEDDEILSYHSEFDNAAWTKINLTVDADTIFVPAPDNTNTADILVENGVNGNHAVWQNITFSDKGLYTFKCYVGRLTRTWVRLSCYSSTAASSNRAWSWFDLTKGIVGTTYGNRFVSAGIEKAENDFWLCSITMQVQENETGSGYAYIHVADADNSISFQGLDRNSLAVWNASVTKGTFLRDYTLDTLPGHSGRTVNRYLPLAELSTVYNAPIEDADVFDARTRGGGIKDEQVNTAIETNPEVQWYGDIGLGGGIPYPSKSVSIVRLPQTLLTEYGGRFDESSVRGIVKNHMAFGHYPVIRYYGVVPDIYLDTDSINSYNIVTNPEAFDNAAWTKTDSSVVANSIIAPSGRVTADTLHEDIGTSSHAIYQDTNSLISEHTYYAEIYTKAINRNHIAIYLQDTDLVVSYGAIFNLTTQTVSASANLDDYFIEEVANGFYRCSIKFTPLTTILNPRMFYFISDGASLNFIGLDQNSLYIWNARVYTGSIKLYWSTVNSDYTFNVYYGTKQDGPFTKDNLVPITNADPNTYTIEDLKINNTYYVYVTAVANGIEGPKSKIMAVKTI
jgi:hypothetical protein